LPFFRGGDLPRDKLRETTRHLPPGQRQVPSERHSSPKRSPVFKASVITVRPLASAAAIKRSASSNVRKSNLFGRYLEPLHLGHERDDAHSCATESILRRIVSMLFTVFVDFPWRSLRPFESLDFTGADLIKSLGPECRNQVVA